MSNILQALNRYTANDLVSLLSNTVNKNAAQALAISEQQQCYMQKAEERLSNARAQRNRLLAAFEGIQAAEDDMEAVIARSVIMPPMITE